MSTSRDTTHGTTDSSSDKLRELVAGLIDVVATQGSRAIDTLGLRTDVRGVSPNVDVVETSDEVLVFADLPAVDPRQVEITLAGNMLTVKGQLAGIEATAGQTIHRHERPRGAFSRSIPLPVAVNPDRVSAESQNGVLTIRIAKAERAKARQIPINAPAH